MVFSVEHILVTAVTGAILTLLLVLVYGRRTADPSLVWQEAVLLAVVVGLSIVFWRMAGNTGPLNDDPIAFVSPNDVLCPVLTYVSVGVYGGLRNRGSQPHWGQIRAALTILSLIVNIVTI